MPCESTDYNSGTEAQLHGNLRKNKGCDDGTKTNEILLERTQVCEIITPPRIGSCSQDSFKSCKVGEIHHGTALESHGEPVCS